MHYSLLPIWPRQQFNRTYCGREACAEEVHVPISDCAVWCFRTHKRSKVVVSVLLIGCPCGSISLCVCECECE